MCCRRGLAAPAPATVPPLPAPSRAHFKLCGAVATLSAPPVGPHRSLAARCRCRTLPIARHRRPAAMPRAAAMPACPPRGTNLPAPRRSTRSWQQRGSPAPIAARRPRSPSGPPAGAPAAPPTCQLHQVPGRRDAAPAAQACGAQRWKARGCTCCGHGSLAAASWRGDTLRLVVIVAALAIASTAARWQPAFAPQESGIQHVRTIGGGNN